MALTSTIAEMAPQVQERLQDPDGIFWLQNFETYAGLAEGISELLLIIGGPTASVNLSVTLQPNTVWQPMPSNLLAITDIVTNAGRLRKTTLRSLDNTLSSWTPSWESERAAVPARWAPIGLNLFVVHPAVLQPVTVNITGIEYPILTPWPPNGTEQSIWHKEIDQALQLYGAGYCRVKEVGNDFQEGLALYQSFLEIAQRLTQIESRKDDLVWTRSLGAPVAPSQVSHR